jgi:hypothetical protein
MKFISLMESNKMTELQAHEKSMNMWKWLWENYPEGKRTYFAVFKEEDYLSCALCKFYNVECSLCCLGGDPSTVNCHGSFVSWSDYKDIDSLNGKAHAEIIYLIIKEKYEKLLKEQNNDRNRCS